MRKHIHNNIRMVLGFIARGGGCAYNGFSLSGYNIRFLLLRTTKPCGLSTNGCRLNNNTKRSKK